MNDTLHNVLQQQINNLYSVFRLKNIGQEFSHSCIYWLLKMCKIRSGARFIKGGTKCISKKLNKHVTSEFKLCYSQIDAYHKNILF